MPEFKVYLHNAETQRPYRLSDLSAPDKASAPAAAIEWMNNAFGVNGDEKWTIDAIVMTNDWG